MRSAVYLCAYASRCAALRPGSEILATTTWPTVRASNNAGATKGAGPMCLKSAPCQTSQRPETEPLDLTLAWDARKSEYCKIFGVGFGFWILGSAKCPPPGATVQRVEQRLDHVAQVARTSDTGLLAASLIPFAITHLATRSWRNSSSRAPVGRIPGAHRIALRPRQPASQ